MIYEPPYDFPFAPNGPEGDPEAQRRAQHFRELDPFPNIPSSLLSSEHIYDYVRVTGMLHPFYPKPDRLKSASYEAWPGKFIRWDNNQQRIVTDVTPNEVYELPANSITFMQIESKIRLPDYIALRFNLRIKHVHRGLLLGTGPLVDPGFKGDLLIPLHNLTSEPYVLSGGEGLIWVEFTKTTHNKELWPAAKGQFHPIEQRKTDVGFETYFERANKNNPIQSSIPSFIRDAREQATRAERSASKALRWSQLFAGIGILAIAGIVLAITLALHSYFQQINANVIAADSLAASIGKDATQAATDARRALSDNEVVRKELEGAKQEIKDLQINLQTLRDALSRQQPTRSTPRP